MGTDIISVPVFIFGPLSLTVLLMLATTATWKVPKAIVACAATVPAKDDLPTGGDRIKESSQ